MSQPKLITKPFASDALPGYVNEIPKENPVGAPDQNASWAAGFPPITMTDIDDGGLPPNGEDMNGVLRAITEHNLFIGGGGVYEFTDEYISEVGGYSKGAVLISDDKTALWMSIQDNNTQNFNGATKNQWRLVVSADLGSTLASIQDALNTKADKSVTITAGDGLTGGGTLAGNRVLAVDNSVVRTDRTITAGTGLSGGGNLSANRTLSVNYGTTAGTAAQGNDARITGAAQKSANLSDLSSASAARQNLGLGTAATRSVGAGDGDVVLVSQRNNSAPSINTLVAVDDSANAWNRPGNYITSLAADNNAMAFSVGSTQNERQASIQVGHELTSYASALGQLHLNPLGGDVLINKKAALHTGNILTATGQSTKFPMTQKAVTDAINNSAIGVGQTWQNVTGSRAAGTIYTNTTGRTIVANISWGQDARDVEVRKDSGSSWIKTNIGTSGSANITSTIIPAGADYRLAGAAVTLSIWSELR